MQTASDASTVVALLEYAIRAEKATQELYQGLARGFSHLSGMAEFWQSLSQDESAHAHALEKIRESLTPEQLALPVDVVVMAQAKRTAGLSVAQTLDSITTLGEAYQLTHDIENSEINTVFEFIVAEFVAQDKQRELAAAQLRQHIDRLNQFPSSLRLLSDTPPRWN